MYYKIKGGIMIRSAIFIANYTIGNSPSILNLINLLIENSIHIDIYIKNVSMIPNWLLKNKYTTIIDLKYKGLVKLLKYLRKYRYNYEFILAIDPEGFVLSKELYPDESIIYYSLELYLSYSHEFLNYPESISFKERNYIHDIKGLIIQSEEKKHLFLMDYGLSSNTPTFILPVTYRGRSIANKSDYLFNKYNIHKNKKIALHLGGIASWFSCIEIAEIFKNIPDWILFFHGYPDNKYLEQLRSKIENDDIANVIISNEIFNDLEEIDNILSSVHLGIAWYNDISVGFRNVGYSSGKISAYLKFGLPIITNRYPSTIEVVEKIDCGICLHSISEIPSAIQNIENNYSQMSINAMKKYESTFNFDKYKDELYKFLINHENSSYS